MSGYLVVDFETTGFSPARHDRVVEVAVVQVANDGAVEDSWSTLINPGRDMGATHVHGITAADVISAPTFHDVAPLLLQAASRRVLVAHNARFDLSFLRAELGKASITLDAEPPYLCTMEWSSTFLAGTSRKLNDCCRLAGVVNQCGHSAEGDALATAGLLAYFLRSCGYAPPWGRVVASAETFAWPSAVSSTQVGLVRRMTTPQTPDAWLDQVTSRVERVADPVIEAYVDVLEQALLDGYLSAHEKRDLGDLAQQLGVSRDQLDKVHRVYLTALASAAWSDGVVSMEEQFQLTQVAASLGIPMQTAKQILIDTQDAKPAFEIPTIHLAPGDRVVFTGELSVPRDQWIDRIARLGLEHGGVSKRTRAVVAADPDSLSGKAAKARDQGIPIITEFAFDAVIRDLEERRAARSDVLAD